MSRVPDPMDVPHFANGGSINCCAGCEMGVGCNKPKGYSIGGLVDDIKDSLGGSRGTLGALIGGVLAAPTGGMSIAAGMGLGSAAGTYSDTQDVAQSLQSGLMGYGLGGLGTGAYNMINPASAPASVNSGTAATNVATSGAKEAVTDAVAGPSFSDFGKNVGSTVGIASYLAGINEEPQQSTPVVNDVDEWYQCMQEKGAGACPMPESLKMPSTQRYNSGQNQSWRNPINLMDGGKIRGPGTETSDSIPAYVSNNEYVLTADAVRGLGNGDVNRGAKSLDGIMAILEKRGRQYHG